ncbi:MAG: hypothetical protein HC905_27145 [Bacteroidales bacterium]|nr:hypothetical protein [Bacteroidales bacterium]
MDIEDKGSVISNLVNKCYKNDQRAQLLLYEMFSSAMFNVSFRITGDRFQAEDIMQESFLTVFEKSENAGIPTILAPGLKELS